MKRTYNIYRKPGQHLTFVHRQIIERAYNSNSRLPKKSRLNIRQLAKKLSLNHVTLGREIKRGLSPYPNTYKDKDIYDYSAHRAQDYIDEGNMNKGCPMKMTNQMAKSFYQLIVTEKCSPYDACKRLIADKVTNVPHPRTIYNHIYKGDINIYCDQTPYGLKRPPKNKTEPKRSLKNPEAISIEERDDDVETREEFGHWEIDCVVSCSGGKGGLLVLIERKSRYTIIRKLKRITQKCVLKAIRSIIRLKQMKVVKSVTSDNGSEFLNTQELTDLFKKVTKESTIYYTHAYSAWEKGSVENVNRIIRRFYPKGTDFRKVSRSQINDLQQFINSIHRKKTLNGQTSNEVFNKAISTAA